MNRRTGVFLFSDSDGKADRYLEHILRDIRGELGYLLAVVCCRADDEAMALMGRYADDIVLAEKGLSAPEGYKAGIGHLTEKGLIEETDELVLFNDTFFGPFIPFGKIFEQADREENIKDIQSLSAYLSIEKNPGGGLILDTYFMMIRKNVLGSCRLAELFGSAEAVDGGRGLPENFAGRDFSYGSVYDTYSFDQIENTVHNPLALLKNGFPVIRREAFTAPYSETVSNTLSSYVNGCFGFIGENYEYDTELIYENIIRCGDPYELLSRLDLNFVLPKNFSLSNLSGDIFGSVVIVFHMYYEQLFDESLSYLDNVPHGTDVIITTTSEDKAAVINEKIGNYPYLREHSRVLVSIGNGRDMAGLLVEAGQYLSGYKYICFTHDKMSLHHKRTSGQSFARTILENVICSREYIANVISVFERNDRLGLLVPPPPEHEAYFAVIGRKWTGNFSYFAQLCEKLGMPVNCTKDSVPFALGTSFWCRYEALKNLFEYPWTHSDFPDEPLPLDGSISHAIERCFPFVAKHNGYLSGIICTTDFAQTLLNNREYMLTDLMKTLNEYIGTEKQTLSSLRKKMVGYFLDLNKPDILKKRLHSIKSNSRVIKRSKFFDKNWYLSAYPDVKDSGLRPEEHYLLKGWRDGYDPSEKFSTSEYLRLNGDVADKKVNPLLHYETYGCAENRKMKLDTGDYRENRLRHSIKRRLGRMLYKKQIARNADKRILVILHMFYMCSWVEIKEYLKNLEVYNYDLIVTYTNVTYNEKVIQGIKEFKSGVRLVECPNVGYDVGPFLFALKDVRLDDYDIVFKLQSKGVNRARCFIYGQYFKKRDWFLNLFEGCIGEFTVHKTIDALGGDNDIGIVAAENLILADPAHKQNMVRAYMKERGIPVPDEYYFVSGTCFAERARLLKTVQDMHYDISEFQAASSGFSTAHKLERIICLTILNDGYKFKGNRVMSLCRTLRKLDPDRIRRKKYSGLRIADDKRFQLDDEFVYFCLENQLYRKYELTELPLSEIKRRWLDDVIPLRECHPYRYLVTGDPQIYQEYCMLNKRYYGLNIMSADRFDSLISSIEEKGYDENSIVVVNQDNILKDGQHRCCYLLYKYGEDYKIPVLRCYEYGGGGLKELLKKLLKRFLPSDKFNSFVKLYRRIRYRDIS